MDLCSTNRALSLQRHNARLININQKEPRNQLKWERKWQIAFSSLGHKSSIYLLHDQRLLAGLPISLRFQ